MVNPRKYFTNQDVGANMPIISNRLFFIFFERTISFSIFPNWRFQWSKNVNVFYRFPIKKAYCKYATKFQSSRTLFLCAVFYIDQMRIHSLVYSSTSGTSPLPRDVEGCLKMKRAA